MCQNKNKANYYIAIGMLISTGTYFLYEAQWIPHWLRFVSLIFAIILMVYGIFKIRFGCKN